MATFFQKSFSQNDFFNISDNSNAKSNEPIIIKFGIIFSIKLSRMRTNISDGIIFSMVLSFIISGQRSVNWIFLLIIFYFHFFFLIFNFDYFIILPWIEFHNLRKYVSNVKLKPSLFQCCSWKFLITTPSGLTPRNFVTFHLNYFNKFSIVIRTMANIMSKFHRISINSS